MPNELNKNAGIISGIKATGTWLKARKAYSAAEKALDIARQSKNVKSIKYRTGFAEQKKLEALVAKKNIKKHFFGQIKPGKTKTVGKKTTTTTTPPTTPEAPKISDKKYSWKALAGAGAAGYFAPKILGGNSEPQYPPYPTYGYPRYGEYEKDASVGKAIGKLLKAIGNKLPNKGSETIGKAIIGTGTAGLGGGLVAGYIVGDDGHDASSHGRKKTAAMTPMEKADQKYAIAKSYERSGHPKKSTEYKNKASMAYKRAWEKKSNYYKNQER